MRSIFAAAALALCVAGCAGLPALPTPPTPAQVTDRTALDEAAGIGATNAYTAASKLGAALARAGLIDKAKFKKADAKGYEAVQAVSAAYFAGNSTNYADAAKRANKAAADIAALVK